MKTRIMFYLLLVALFGFSGNLLAMEEPMDTMAEPSKIGTPKKDNVIISPNGTENTHNTFYGQYAGENTTGGSNTFIGVSAGYSNTDGSANSFSGFKAGYSNTTGDWNSFFGPYAGESNTEENNNSFFGNRAGNNNTTEGNSFFGSYAGYYNTTGGYNSFFGRSAGYRNTTGGYNSFFGRSAGENNTTGGQNSFFGRSAGYNNTTGGYNSFFGQSAGENNTIGGQNSFFGRYTGYNNTTGDYNSFFGLNAGAGNTTGNHNTFVGWYAGFTNETGEGNIFLGNNAGFAEKGSNKLYIDNSTTSTPLIWGDFEANNVVIYGGFRAIASYSSSDRRWKKNIESLESSLDKVSNLQGVSYEWKTDEYSDFGLMEGKQIGLVAQDVEQVLPELVSEGKDGYKAVSYTKLTAVLVEAVKELKTESQRRELLLIERLKKQQTEIEELRSMIKELKG